MMRVPSCLQNEVNAIGISRFTSLARSLPVAAALFAAAVFHIRAWNRGFPAHIHGIILVASSVSAIRAAGKFAASAAKAAEYRIGPQGQQRNLQVHQLTPFSLIPQRLEPIHSKGVNLWPKTRPLRVRTAVRRSSSRRENKSSTPSVDSASPHAAGPVAKPARRSAVAAAAAEGRRAAVIASEAGRH